ncbi:hypothetical protein RRG08_018582 [Elysia crispata]|uniref:Neurotransmitter-gated ion-channel ligand-binding domain-containing protein n=1 Tax=Elysia crispata TaxID=231223 RepID=A0AAE1A865_9GAST|nr:hypothetical protein RRG08_018582 [Elysia crispata]
MACNKVSEPELENISQPCLAEMKLRHAEIDRTTLVSIFKLLQRCVAAPVDDVLVDFDNELNITSKEKILVRRLLSRYERQGKEGRPVVNTSDAVRVNFGLSLIQILDVDVKNQILKTNIWYEYSYKVVDSDVSPVLSS